MGLLLLSKGAATVAHSAMSLSLVLQDKTRLMRSLMTHKYRGSIVVLSISKSVKPNEELKEMISDFSKVFSVTTEIVGNR